MGSRAVAISELLTGLSAEPMNRGVVNRHENGLSPAVPDAGPDRVASDDEAGIRVSRCWEGGGNRSSESRSIRGAAASRTAISSRVNDLASAAAILSDRALRPEWIASVPAGV